jgi:hypothetical protein
MGQRRQWQRDAKKERFWRRLLRRWRRSGLSVRAFCAQHGVSEPLFFAWRRTIQQRDDETARLERRNGHALGGLPTSNDAPAFVPVQVVAAAPPALEVVLRHGRMVRVAAGFDAEALRQLLQVLEEPRC